MNFENWLTFGEVMDKCLLSFVLVHSDILNSTGKHGHGCQSTPCSYKYYQKHNKALVGHRCKNNKGPNMLP